MAEKSPESTGTIVVRRFALILAGFVLLGAHCPFRSHPDDPNSIVNPGASDDRIVEIPLFFNPQVATDGNGEVVIVAVKGLDFGGFTNGREFPPPDAQQVVQTGLEGVGVGVLDGDDDVDFIAALAMGTDGTGFAVWRKEVEASQTAPLYQYVDASIYRPGSGWAPPERIFALERSQTVEVRMSPVVVTDGRGNAFAAWREDQYMVWVRPYRNGEWGTSHRVVTGDKRDFPDNSEELEIGPGLAMNSSGDALLVWQTFRRDSDMREIWAEHHDADTGWQGSHVRLDDGASEVSGKPHVAMDDNGNALVVWQHDGLVLLAQHFRPGIGWDPTATQITDFGSRPRLAMARTAGTALVVYHRDFDSVHARAFDPAAGWGPEEVVLDEGCCPAVDMDAAGNAVAAMRRFSNLSISRYSPVSGWGEVEALDNKKGLPSSYGARAVDVAMDGAFGAIVVWAEAYSSEISGEPVRRIGKHVLIGPQASFAATPAPGLVDEPVDFDAAASTSPTPIVSFEWDFENDGTIDATTGGVLPTARHIYFAEGTYTVRLRITDEMGFVDETTQDVVVEGNETVTLTIVIVGAGSGSVGLDPLGEMCATTCSYEVKPGSRIYVLPLADAGSEFGGIAGCDQPGDFDLGLEGCGALVTEDRTLTVTFDPE